ncbi:MAG: glycosyltransferase [Thermoplasmatales archaeon]
MINRRILIIGRAKNFNLEEYVFRAFLRGGNEVSFIGYSELLGGRGVEVLRFWTTRSRILRSISYPFWLDGLNKAYYEAARKYNPDLVLSIKGETLSPKTIDSIKDGLGIPVALWYPDDPRFFSSLVKYTAPHYDHVFTCSANAIGLYKDLGVQSVHRLPFGCDPYIHNLDSNNLREKRKRTLFIGSFSIARFRFIKNLINKGVPIDVMGPNWNTLLISNSKGKFGLDYVRTIQDYSVVLNVHQNPGYGPNMRTFEVTGSGGLLLSDNAEDIGSFFSIGTDILVYQSTQEAEDSIKSVLSGEIDVEKMSKRAYEKCHEYHTYDVRIREILKLCRN